LYFTNIEHWKSSRLEFSKKIENSERIFYFLREIFGRKFWKNFLFSIFFINFLFSSINWNLVNFSYEFFFSKARINSWVYIETRCLFAALKVRYFVFKFKEKENAIFYVKIFFNIRSRYWKTSNFINLRKKMFFFYTLKFILFCL